MPRPPTPGAPLNESIEYEGIESGALTEVDESYIDEASGDEKDFIESMIANYDLDHPDEPAAEAAPDQRGQRPGWRRRRRWRQYLCPGSSSGR